MLLLTQLSKIQCLNIKRDLIVSNSKTVKPGLHLQVAACADREFFFSRRRGSDGYFSLPGILRHIFGNFIIMKIERNWNFARGMGCLDP